jgi:hypothetical protein
MEDGGNSSSIIGLQEISLTSITTIKFLIQPLKIKRVKQLDYGREMVESIKDGVLDMLTKHQRLRLRDSTKNSDSSSTDHSTLFLNYHSTELLRAQEQTILFSRDGERTGSDNNSTSMRDPRQSDLNNGRTMPWKSKAMEEALTSD